MWYMFDPYLVLSSYVTYIERLIHNFPHRFDAFGFGHYGVKLLCEFAKVILGVAERRKRERSGMAVSRSKLRGLVDLRWAWVCELRNQEKVRVTKVNTAYNKADILTKCMPAYKFRMCMRTIQGDQESRNVASLVQVLSS